jgi:hypothetical protein
METLPDSSIYRTNLRLNVVERGRANDREADQENVGLGIGKRAEAVVILLSSGIPESKANRLSIDHDTGRVVIESGKRGR